jgi:hypothetical protein
MTIICIHIALHLELFGKSIKSDFQLNLIPKYHWWEFVVVLGGAHEPVSSILISLFHFLDIFGLYDLVYFSGSLVTKFLQVD